MGPSSSFVEHHDFLDVFLQPFTFNQKAECSERRVGSGETETDDIGVKEPPGPKKLVRSGDSASSASTRKLERGDDIQIGRTKLEFHNMQTSDHRYLEKVFKNLRKN